MVDSRGKFMIMKRAGGYTIVEVMIFLGVTTALFVMIAGTFSGRQARAEFSTSARDMESRIQDIANDISTGYYNNPGNAFQCRVSGSNPPVIDSADTNEHGSNDDCIFIGRVAHLDLAGVSGEQYNLYSVVGARQVTSGGSSRDSENFTDAKPRPITSPPFASSVDLTETIQAPSGVILKSVYADYGTGKIRIRAVGFFTTFGAGSADPTSLSVNIIPLAGPPAGASKADVTGAISGITDAAEPFFNPPSGVVICMEGSGVDQHALLTIGGNRSRLTTDLKIGEGSCDTTAYPA
jgi:hypothetical protein